VRGNKAQRREKRAKRPPTWAAEQTRSQGKEKALSQRWSWPNRAEKRGVNIFSNTVLKMDFESKSKEIKTTPHNNSNATA
jgi:hypothetical protein